MGTAAGAKRAGQNKAWEEMYQARSHRAMRNLNFYLSWKRSRAWKMSS